MKKSWILLLTLINLNMTIGQSINCATVGVAETTYHPLTCDLDTVARKCIQVKVHFINNSSNKSEFTELFEVIDLLKDVNEIFDATKLSFTLGETCVVRDSLPEIINRDSFSINQNLQYDSTAIDIFFLQSSIGAPRAGGTEIGQSSAIMPLSYFSDAKVLAHELGHVLGLAHTFSGGLNSVDAECKIRDSTCLFKGDRICDTGADPYLMDLDGDGNPDSLKWVTNCTENITSSVKDACQDSVLSWNIPVSNIMSYYNTCFFEFSQCQSFVMHQNLLNKFSELLFDCDGDLMEALKESPCQDIVIDSDVTWTDTTVALCFNQRIVITSTGILRLNNSTLTRGSINLNVCDQIKSQAERWNGILIEGGSNGYKYYDLNGNQVVVGAIGAIYSSGSTIEHSMNGIETGPQFGAIRLNNSTLQNNGRFLNVRDSRYNAGKGKYSGSKKCGEVVVKGSSLIAGDKEHDPFFDLDQARINGAAALFHSTSIDYEGSLEDNVTAINSISGRLSLTARTGVNNYWIGVYKDTDAMSFHSSRGLNVYNSNFSACKYAIINRSQLLVVNRNVIDGVSYSAGRCNGLWEANKFIQSLIINDGATTNEVLSNKFIGGQDSLSLLYLSENNLFTDVRCNFWSDSLSVNSKSAWWVLPFWGSSAKPSGNIRDTKSNTMIGSSAHNTVTNYFANLPQHTFLYSSNIQGEQSLNINVTCDYESARDSLNDSGSEEIYSDTTLTPQEEVKWLEKDSILNEIVNALDTATGSNMDSLTELFFAQSVQKDKILRHALLSHDLKVDSVKWDYWADRISPEYKVNKLFDKALEEGQMDTLIDFLENIEVDSCDSNDLSDLEDCIAIFQIIQSDTSRDVTGLTHTEIYSLRSLAEKEEGVYNSPIRRFLNEYYGIKFLPQWSSPDPPYSNIFGINDMSTEDISLDDSLNQLAISPNPTNDCIFISGLKEDKRYAGQIVALDGRIMQTEPSMQTNELCLSVPGGIYILQIRETVSGKTVYHGKVIYK